MNKNLTNIRSNCTSRTATQHFKQRQQAMPIESACSNTSILKYSYKRYIHVFAKFLPSL